MFLRNHTNCTTQCVSGFYVSRSGHFEKVTVTWSEGSSHSPIFFSFMCIAELIHNPPDSGGVRDAIKEVLTSVTADNIDPKENKRFGIPLGVDTVRRIWGDSAVQLKSGYSLVIKVIEDKVVYKHPFNGSEKSQLIWLLQFAEQRKQWPTRCSFPKSFSRYGYTDEYFKFDMYQAPYSRETARKNIVVFVEEVIECIKELHALKFAHLDIRLENVCFNAARKAVLIDLDRSLECDTLAEFCCQSAESTMYQSPFEGATCENLDWKQFSIMICFILSTESMPYHSIFIRSEEECIVREKSTVKEEKSTRKKSKSIVKEEKNTRKKSKKSIVKEEKSTQKKSKKSIVKEEKSTQKKSKKRKPKKKPEEIVKVDAFLKKMFFRGNCY